MTVANILALAPLQGEVLPISSSAHVILVPAMTGQGLMVDAALHLGTLLAKAAGVQ